MKQRHGCLTAWLVLMIIGNALAAVANLAMGGMLAKQFPNAPGWAFPVLAVLGACNVVFAIALMSWKKWAFFAFSASAVVALVVNLMIGVNPVQAVLGLVGVAVLYGVLQIGSDNKGWPQLE